MVIKLVRLSDGLEFIFTNTVSLTDSKTQGLTSMPIAGNDYSNSQVLAFTGITREVRLTSVLTDQNTDVSNGTNSTPVKTVGEQHNYLMDTFFTTSNRYKFYHDVFFPNGQECSIKSIDITDVSDDPNKSDLEITLIFGQVTTL